MSDIKEIMETLKSRFEGLELFVVSYNNTYYVFRDTTIEDLEKIQDEEVLLNEEVISDVERKKYFFKQLYNLCVYPENKPEFTKFPLFVLAEVANMFEKRQDTQNVDVSI